VPSLPPSPSSAEPNATGERFEAVDEFRLQRLAVQVQQVREDTNKAIAAFRVARARMALDIARARAVLELARSEKDRLLRKFATAHPVDARMAGEPLPRARGATDPELLAAIVQLQRALRVLGYTQPAAIPFLDGAGEPPASPRSGSLPPKQGEAHSS